MKHLMKSVMSLMLGLMCFASCTEDTPEEESYFTVSFNSMGGSEVDAQSVKAGEYAVKPENPIKEGMAFTGWYTSEKYESQWDFAGDAVNSDITLYAKWVAPDKVCTVTFETNGGNKVDPMKVEKGCALSYLPVPEKEGFVFDGWYKEPSFTTQYEIGTKVDADITLYAKWKAESDDAVRKLLEELIAEAEGLKQGDYSESSYKQVQDALKAAKEVIAKTDATTEELQKAYDGLKMAVDGLFPMVAGKPYSISCNSGALWEGKYVMVDRYYMGYGSLEFEVLDKGGNRCGVDAAKLKFEYDKSLVKQWAEDALVEEDDTHIWMVFNGSQTEGAEVEVKATSVADPSISMTVVLKICSSDWIDKTFVETVEKLPQADAVNFDNYMEVMNLYNSATALCIGISEENFATNPDLKSALEKLNAFDNEFEDNWFHSPFVHIKDDVYYVNESVCKYTSNGDKFPGGVFISDKQLIEENWYFQEKMEFTQNEYIYWSKEFMDDKEGEWKKDMKCEYRYIPGENGMGTLISHFVEEYYGTQSSALSARHLFKKTFAKR